MAEITMPEIKLPDIKLPDGLRDMTKDDLIEARDEFVKSAKDATKDVKMPKKIVPTLESQEYAVSTLVVRHAATNSDGKHTRATNRSLARTSNSASEGSRREKNASAAGSKLIPVATHAK